MNGLTPYQQSALAVIKVHKRSKPITGKDLANEIGLKPRTTGKDGADMRSIINALRTKGYPICAHGEGYYWPASRKELNEYVESFQARIDDQQKACDALRESWDKLDNITLEQEKMYMYRAGGVMYHVLESKRAQFLVDHEDAVFVDPNN